MSVSAAVGDSEGRRRAMLQRGGKGCFGDVVDMEQEWEGGVKGDSQVTDLGLRG